MQDQSIFTLQELLQKPNINSLIQHQSKINVVIKILDTEKSLRKHSEWFFLIQEIEHIPFFQNIIQTNGYSKLLFILYSGEIKRFKRKDIIIKAGQYFKGIYVLLDGIISKQMVGSARQLEKNNFKRGTVFGDKEVYENCQSEYIVTVLTNSVFYFISYQAFSKHILNSIFQSSPIKQSYQMKASMLGMSRSVYRNKTPSLERLLSVRSYLKNYLIENFQVASLIGRCDFENLLNLGIIEKFKPRAYAYKEGQKIEFLYFILIGEFLCLEISDYNLSKSIVLGSETESETIINPIEQKFESLSVNKFDKSQDIPQFKRLKPICLVGKGNILGFPDAINSQFHINSAQCKGQLDGLLWKVPQESFFKQNISMKQSLEYSKQLENLQRAKPASQNNAIFQMRQNLFNNLNKHKTQTNIKQLEDSNAGFIEQIKKFQIFKKQIDYNPLLSRFRVQSLLIQRIPLKYNKNFEKFRRKVQTSLSIENSHNSTGSILISKNNLKKKNQIYDNLRKSRAISLIQKTEPIHYHSIKTISLSRLHETQKQDHYNTLTSSLTKYKQDQQKTLDSLSFSQICFQQD